MKENLIILESDLENLIDSVSYKSTGKSVICVLKLVSGFEIVGTSSVLDVDKFDLDIGKEIAYEEGLGRLWDYEGYRL